MPKALLFTTDFPPSNGGGICTHSSFMVNILKPHGWDFNVLCEYYLESSNDEIEIYSRENNVKIRKLKESPNVIQLIKKIWFCYKYAKIYNPDVIIGTGRHTSWYAAIISKLIGKPLITIGHGTEFTQKTSKNDFKWNRLAYSQSTILIAISHHTKKIIQDANIRPKKIEVIHNAADEKRFIMLDKERVNKFKMSKGLENKKIILATGSITERKGQKIIIQALPKIIEKFPEIMFVAVGIPIIKDELIELAQELKINDHIIFTGKINDDELLLWLNSCDLFSMTSINHNGDYEGFGIAVMEAALCGKTSIVSDNGGLKEAVIDNLTGIIVPENNSDATAKAVIKLFEDPELRANLSKNAHKNAVNNHSYTAKSMEYLNAFNSCLK
jgi:phosphatidylinositol alpha-1,6-mannosyltransferase